MSCIMLSNKYHACLAEDLAQILNGGFNRVHFDAPQSLKDALDNCKGPGGEYLPRAIAMRLWGLNAQAFAERYGEGHPDDVAELLAEKPDFPDGERALILPTEYQNGHAMINRGHYRLAKRLDCYIYQTSEGAAVQTKLYAGLVELSGIVKSFIVQCSEEYDAAGRWAEP